MAIYFFQLGGKKMNEELLQQAICQLKMLKDATIETVSILNTDYTDGTTRFSVEVTYEDELYLEDEQPRTDTKIHIDEDLFKSVVFETLDANNITVGDLNEKSISGIKDKFIREEFENQHNAEATAGDYNVALEYDSEGHKQFIKENLNKFVKFK